MGYSGPPKKCKHFRHWKVLFQITTIMFPKIILCWNRNILIFSLYMWIKGLSWWKLSFKCFLPEDLESKLLSSTSQYSGNSNMKHWLWIDPFRVSAGIYAFKQMLGWNLKWLTKIAENANLLHFFPKLCVFFPWM